jgi:hypothetical protein
MKTADPTGAPNVHTKRLRKLVLSLALLVFLVPIVFGIVYIINTDAPPPLEPIEYTAVPLRVENTTGEVNGKKIDRGHIVHTQEWIVVVDEASLIKPSTHFGNFEPPLLTPSKTLSGICEIARKQGKPVTFKGVKSRDQTHNGLPVLLVTHITYAEQEFKVAPYSYK